MRGAHFCPQGTDFLVAGGGGVWQWGPWSSGWRGSVLATQPGAWSWSEASRCRMGLGPGLLLCLREGWGMPSSGHTRGDQPSLPSRTTWTWLRPPHLTPCYMTTASRRRRRPWWTVIMLPSLEPFPPRGLKTNSMVEFHMHLLDFSHVVPLCTVLYSL